MKKIKSILAVLMCMGLILVMTACSGGDSGSKAPETQTPAETDKVDDAAETDNAAPEENDDNADASKEDLSGITIEEGKLIMGTNAAFPPYEYYEGDKIVGIDAEIAQAIADELGLELEIHDLEFNAVLMAIPTGNIDMGMAGMTVNEDRLESMDFSKSYAKGVQVIIVPQDSDIKTLDDLNGKKIGVQIATTGDQYVANDYGEESVERYSKGADAVMALNSGKIDCVVIDNEPAKSFVEENENLKILDTEYVTEEYAIGVKKGNTKLLSAIDEALDKLTQDGTVKNIIDKYISAE